MTLSGRNDNSLPPGWVSCSIADVTLPVSKIDPRDDLERKIRYIDISGIDNDRNVIGSTKTYRLGDAPSRAKQIVRSGDVLFATVRPYLRNIAAVPRTCDEEIASTGFAVLRPAPGINPAFLFYMATSADFVDTLSGLQYGVSYPAVTDDQVRARQMPLPPTREQARIVAKIEELFSELDNAIANLLQAKLQLAAYRDALLKAAFEGRLTTQWREENGHDVDPLELIEAVKKARDTQHETRLREWDAAKANGKAGARPRTPKRFAKLAAAALGELPDLPRSWAWDRLGWMTCGVEYGTSAKSKDSGAVPVLRMGNIQNGSLDWSDLAFTSDLAEIERYQLHDGDVLFNRTNSPELVGKTALYRASRPAIFAGYLIRINHLPKVVDGRYLSYFLNSPIARQYGNTVKTDGVNQSNINGQKLQDYPFPYCTLPEQHRIADILEQRLSLVDELDRTIDDELKTAEALRQGILRKAFAGQLVEQSQEDEPASILLERIASENGRAAQEDGTRRTTRRRRAGT